MLRRLLAALCLALLPLRAQAPQDWTPERWFAQPKSPRIANYRIQASLDWPAKTLEGRETLTWRNAGTAPTSELPLHLYLNAFKGPRSRFVQEGGRGGLGAALPADPLDWGYCRLTGVTLDGQELPGHYGEDETVWWVKLPRPVAPGETLRLDVAWDVKFPKVISRSGWGGLFLMGAQWFPKVGVYQKDRWNCAPYHAHTEFFSDFGTYDVELSLPNALLLAHTGTQTNFKTAEDVTPDPKRPLNIIWKLHAEDVHDFAWAVMPSRSWSYKKFEYRHVQIFYFFQGENLDALPRQHEAVKAALRHGSEWSMPYPYPVLTVVDVPEEAREADGMEYPTLVTAGSVAFDPFLQRMAPEQVTVHEVGHQWFYGILASDEVQEPWLDEGLTSWFTHRVLERNYQAILATRRFHVGTDFGEWLGYWLDPSVDPLSRSGAQTRSYMSYDIAAYAKPTLVLQQLEALLGRPVVEQALRDYTRDHAFRHPTAADLKRALERASGRDLTAFWRDFVEGTETLDYVIAKVQSPQVLEGGWMERGKDMAFAAPQQVAPGRRGRIVLERRGGIRLPVTLWVRLQDRSEHRLVWDGMDRWTAFEFDAPVAAAVLDPDGNHPMLKDRLHASWTARPARRGLHYWSQVLWGGITSLLQGIGVG